MGGPSCALLGSGGHIWPAAGEAASKSSKAAGSRMPILLNCVLPIIKTGGKPSVTAPAHGEGHDAL